MCSVPVLNLKFSGTEYPLLHNLILPWNRVHGLILDFRSALILKPSNIFEMLKLNHVEVGLGQKVSFGIECQKCGGVKNKPYIKSIIEYNDNYSINTNGQ